MNSDVERARSNVHNHSQSESESGKQDEGGVVMVCIEDFADATRKDGPSSPGEGESGRREADVDESLLATTGKSNVPATVTNGTREMRDKDKDTRRTGDGAGQATDATASDSREPNCNAVVPSAEGYRDRDRDREGKADDGDDNVGPSHKWRASASASASASPGKERVPSSETSPASSVGIGDDRKEDGGDQVGEEVASGVGTGSDEAMGADDFLPLFALVLVSRVELLAQ